MAQLGSLLTNTRNFYDPYIIISFLLYFSQIQASYMTGVNEIARGVRFRQGVHYRHFPIIGSHCETKSLPPSPHLKIRKCKFWLCHWDSQSYNDTKVLWCPNGPPHPKHMLSGHIRSQNQLVKTTNFIVHNVDNRKIGQTN